VVFLKLSVIIPLRLESDNRNGKAPGRYQRGCLDNHAGICKII